VLLEDGEQRLLGALGIAPCVHDLREADLCAGVVRLGSERLCVDPLCIVQALRHEVRLTEIQQHGDVIGIFGPERLEAPDVAVVILFWLLVAAGVAGGDRRVIRRQRAAGGTRSAACVAPGAHAGDDDGRCYRYGCADGDKGQGSSHTRPSGGGLRREGFSRIAPASAARDQVLPANRHYPHGLPSLSSNLNRRLIWERRA
jgi:hypothetical protein